MKETHELPALLYADTEERRAINDIIKFLEHLFPNEAKNEDD